MQRQELIREDCNLVTRGSLAGLEALRGECILVTGGTGFLGAWLAELVTFLNDEHGFGTRLLLLASRAHSFSGRAPHLALRDDVTLIERDVRGLLDIPAEVGWIVHAAGTPDRRVHASDPITTMDVVVNGTRAVLNAATRLPDLKKFLYVSSGLVYGAQPENLETMPESFMGSVDCGAINAAYTEAKRCAETICSVYRNQHKLPMAIARPFAFIGPYQLLDRPWAINNFVRDGLLGGPIRIQGDGQTVRSYMYAADLAFWMLTLLARGVVGRTYNVGSPHGVSLLDLANQIAGYLSPAPKVVLRTMHDSDANRSRFVPDIRLAADSLGLDPGTDLATALKRTLQWNQLSPAPEVRAKVSVAGN